MLFALDGANYCYFGEKMEKKDKSHIRVIGAREHNLKDVSVDIPKESLTVITGPSGSGKSTLALDILYAEGKRRYTESLSSYARQFLGATGKPDVDQIVGLCPAIAIEQKTVGSNPRSTVGTITEIYDYLRVLFTRIGTMHCPTCKRCISQESPEKIATLLDKTFRDKYVTVAAPLVRERKGEFANVLATYFGNGYIRFIIDGKSYRFNSLDEIKALRLKKTFNHSIDVLIDHVQVTESERQRVTEAIERAFALTSGNVKIIVGEQEYTYSSQRMCVACAQSFPELEPRLFSFNSPVGACTKCHGIGEIHNWPWHDDDPDAWKSKYPEFFSKYATIQTCAGCDGKRLNQYALAVTVAGKNIDELARMPIKNALAFFKTINLPVHEHEIAKTLLKEIINRLTFLVEVGLPYLTLGRGSRTLSGGEGQRIRLATQIGSALSGVLYILDEPSIGLHQRDNDRLIKTLQSLRDQGNTVLVVEHDIDTIKAADYVVDMGPAAGVHGGNVCAVGAPDALASNDASLTGAYLSGKRAIVVPERVRTPHGFMTLSNASTNNLVIEKVKIPLGVLCGVCGVSGSGKSSLVMEELVPAVERGLTKPGQVVSSNARATLEGAQSLLNVVVVDQSPIGRTPRSNPATYLGIFDDIRELFAGLPESKIRGYAPGRFSFNVAQGRCFECQGDGEITVSMHFLPDVTVQCKSCKGRRYNAQTLEIVYKGKNIYDVLRMTAYEAREFFSAHSMLVKRLQLLCDVGLDYIALGQPATTLSGGEAQRIKLVKELAKRGTRTLYVLDEPTTGLHNCDIEKLLSVLNKLIDKGNSVVVIEHNLDFLKTADYLIDLGPEGGDEGGRVVTSGTPREVARCKSSYTGRYLSSYLS